MDLEATPTSLESVFDDRQLKLTKEKNRKHAAATRLRRKNYLETIQIELKKLQDDRTSLLQVAEKFAYGSILAGLVETDDDSTDSDSSVCTNDDLRSSDACASPMSGISPSTSSVKDVNTLLDLIHTIREDSVSDSCLEVLTRSYGSRKLSFAEGLKPTSSNEAFNDIILELTSSLNQPQKKWTPQVSTCHSGGCKERNKVPSKRTLERVRKMRNRVHAKVTRQRKKVFVSAIEKATSLVWEANEKLREALISCGGLKVEA